MELEQGRIPLDETSYLATETEKLPNKWVNNPLHFANKTKITSQDYDLEYLLMSLRLQTGCDLNRLQTHIINHKNLEALIDDRLLVWHDNYIIATKQGRPLLNALIRELTN